MVEKMFLFIATEDRSYDVIFDSPMHYPLFSLVNLPATPHLLIFVFFFVLKLLFYSRTTLFSFYNHCTSLKRAFGCLLLFQCLFLTDLRFKLLYV